MAKTEMESSGRRMYPHSQHDPPDNQFLNNYSINQESKLSMTPLKRPRPTETFVLTSPKRHQLFPSQIKSQQQEIQQKIVIYRNAKYNGVFGRFKVYVKNYAQLLLLQPLLPIMSEFHKYFLEILGFIYFTLMTLPHVCITLFLLLLRRCRLFLVRKYYPAALVCEDLSPRCIFVGESLGLVTCVIWIKGKVDAHKLRSYFLSKSSPSSNSILRKKLTDLFGLRVLRDLEPKSKFDISNHIAQAPKEFLKFFIREETLPQYGKSALQQFVTKCASEKLNSELPPWKITVIPQPVYEKEKTCCVLQFHYILVQISSVHQLLDNIFTQRIYGDEPILFRHLPELSPISTNEQFLENQLAILVPDTYPPLSNSISNGSLYSFIPRKNNYDEFSVRIYGNDFDGTYYNKGDFPKSHLAAFEEIQLDFEIPRNVILSYILKLADYLQRWIHANVHISTSDIRAWANLHKKQLQFHAKLDIAKSIISDISIFFKKLGQCIQFFPQSCNWAELKYVLLQLLLICRAICFVPVEIFACVLHTYPRGGNGFRKSDRNETHRISWSSPISKNLLNAICRKTGATVDSIILTACSLALKEYYCETNLPNPKRLGIIMPIVTKDLLAPTGFSTLDLRTDDISLCDQLQTLDMRLKEFPAWKLLGNYFLGKYLSYVIPRPLSYLVFRKIFKRYPISFTKLNLQSPTSIQLPHMSIWGQPVEEFLYWRPPQSDYCVSIALVKYSENLRLSVLSPMKSLDIVLTQKFCQHLNRIAEAVGVDKSLIPYSRKSSPVSSHCSSPSVLKTHEAILGHR